MAHSQTALLDRAPRETPRRKGERTRTIPEQIADHVGIAIVNGEYKGGERVREQELADLYGVSRGPVREAIRALEKRGLVQFFPRRGAYVVDLSIDAIADVFNVRAALMGLAARSLARREDPEARALLHARVDEMAAAARPGGADPVRFARLVGRCGMVVAWNCGNSSLTHLLTHQGENSLWGLIWRERALDFTTPARRRESVEDWRALAAAIDARRDAEAELLFRRILFRSRDAAIATLRKLRGETVDRARLIADD
jgi:DNA-binding GntR family transcriptional regulator